MRRAPRPAGVPPSFSDRTRPPSLSTTTNRQTHTTKRTDAAIPLFEICHGSHLTFHDTRAHRNPSPACRRLPGGGHNRRLVCAPARGCNPSLARARSGGGEIVDRAARPHHALARVLRRATSVPCVVATVRGALVAARARSSRARSARVQLIAHLQFVHGVDRSTWPTRPRGTRARAR